MSAGDAGRGGRAAFYALRPGGWRDYWTLLHPPYTAWHLSYVVLGSVVAARLNAPYLALTVGAFFLGVGVAAHALDERMGRPLGTRIPDRVLDGLAIGGLAGAVALGVLGCLWISWWLLAFIAFGAFIVPAYNLELIGGRFHSDLWFALAWGAFPALTGYFAQTATIGWQALMVAAGCGLASAAQRTLSTPARRLRREAAAVSGHVVFRDGRREPLDEAALRAAPEAALRLMAGAVSLLAVGLVLARLY